MEQVVGVDFVVVVAASKLPKFFVVGELLLLMYPALAQMNLDAEKSQAFDQKWKDVVQKSEVRK